jgi:hypothetical protein
MQRIKNGLMQRTENSMAEKNVDICKQKAEPKMTLPLKIGLDKMIKQRMYYFLIAKMQKTLITIRQIYTYKTTLSKAHSEMGDCEKHGLW